MKRASLDVRHDHVVARAFRAAPSPRVDVWDDVWVLRLRIVEDRDFSQIAATLGMSEVAA